MEKAAVSFVGKKSRPFEWLIEKSLGAVAFSSIIFITLIFIFVFREASTIFFHDSEKNKTPIVHEEYESYGDDEGKNNLDIPEELSEDFHESKVGPKELLSSEWIPVSLRPKYGLLPLFMGSLKVALVALFIAAPFAIFAALFTSSFAPAWLKETLKPVIEMLAAFPSVVVGFFALSVLASLLQNLFGLQFRLNAFVGGVALALAIIPVIYTISDDALTAVPASFVEASLALGASKWQTVLFVVLPAALPGIFAAVLLGVGRAIGETMIVLMATGNAAMLSANPFESVRTLSATIGAEMAEVVFGDMHYSVLFFIGVLLFIFSFTLCFVAEVVIRDRLMRKFRGGEG
jgi:phosphate transport system permease protein